MFTQSIKERAKFALIIESCVELLRFLDFSEILLCLTPVRDLLLRGTWHACPFLSDPDTTGHLQQPPGSVPHSQQPPGSVPKLPFPAEGLCPSPGTTTQGAVSPAQSRGSTKQFPFCSWERVRKGCDGKMLVMLITCDNSIKWNDS